MAEDKNINDRLRTSKILWYMYWMFIVASIVLVVRIVQLKVFWEPEPKTAWRFRPSKSKEVIKPERGAIIDHNGKLLAVSTPMYDIYMDCTVLKGNMQRTRRKARRRKTNGRRRHACWQTHCRKSLQKTAKTPPTTAS